MGFWPFGHGKKSRQRKSEDHESSLLKKAHTEDMARQEKAALKKSENRSSRADTNDNRNEQSRKLSKNRPGYASEPTRSYTTPLRSTEVQNGQNGQTSKEPPTDSQRQNQQVYQHTPMSQSSIVPESFTAMPPVPTLHARRADFDPTVSRKKSSKRKAEDQARERELRQSSRNDRTPNKLKRPATYSGSGPLVQDTKDVAGGMNRKLKRPSSQVSLPTAGNISETDESIPASSFKVGILAALSPRPTVKYDSSPRSAIGKSTSRLATVQQSLLEEDEDLFTSRKRIADLADDLNSTALRDLMEKDRRRKEKKKETDRSRLQRKLQKQREKQKEEEVRRTRTEEYASHSRANIGLQDDDPPSSPPVAPEEAAVASISNAQATRDEEDPFRDPTGKDAPTTIRNPFEDENDMDVMQEPPVGEVGSTQPIPIQSARRKATPIENEPKPKMPSQAAFSPPTPVSEKAAGKRHVSQSSGYTRDQTPDIPEMSERDRRPSDQNSQTVGSWTNFFRRGTRKGSAPDRGRVTPSEFSNASRESFSRKQPPPVVAPGRSFRTSDSAIPQRTMSKFREDLPELPLSPPDSRVQSPEADEKHGFSSKHPDSSTFGTLDGRSLATSSSIPTVERGRPDSRLQSGISEDMDMTNADTSKHALSQSLASVDSEGSWLSGRPVKRLSGPMSASSKQGDLQSPVEQLGAGENEDEDLTHDEYLSRLTPAPEERRQSGISSERRASSTLIDLAKEREQSPPPSVPPLPRPTSQGEMWHDSVGQKATIVQTATRAKSREGLLKDFQKAESGSVSGDESAEEEIPIMRAKSVEYKGHARHVSAGSARILDIRRSSVVDASTPPRSPALPKSAMEAVQGTEESSTEAKT